MPDSAIDKVTASPFATVTGPLGFGGLLIFWMLQGISTEVQDASQSQAELQLRVAELTSAVRSLTEKADSGAAADALQRSAISALESRVTRLEAQAAASKKKR